MLVDTNEDRSTADDPRCEGIRSHCGSWIFPGRVIDILRDSPTGYREARNLLLAVSASKGREKWVLLTTDEAVLFDGEFQEKDPVLYCWPPRKGPALAGV